MKPNRYPGKCTKCGDIVKPRAGTIERSPTTRKWLVTHNVCPAGNGRADWEPSEETFGIVPDPRGGDRVIEIRTSGGTFYRNAKGTCEDAPCCGCCTF
jgi:hypothetical protein